MRSTDDGLHLSDSILWFDSQATGDLSFLSSAGVVTQTKVPQVIATEETVKILEACRRKTNALVCQYNRPFSIGRLRMELLPSGSVLGGASLYVETEHGRLLYAPHLQTHRLATVRQMQLKRANTLILGAFHPDPLHILPNRKKERERLVDATKKLIAANQYPVIYCKPIATAQEITKILTDEGITVAVHPTIYRVNRVYESFGSKLGNYSLFSKRSDVKTRVLLLPSPEHKSARYPLPKESPIFFIEELFDKPTENGTTHRYNIERFFLSSTCDGTDLREVVSAVSPKELYFFGPYTRRYVEELKGLAPKVKPLYTNDQPTLF